MTARWVHVLLDVPPEQAEVSGHFWSDVLGWPLGDPWADLTEFRSFEPPVGDAYVHQQIGDHGPRVHLDLEVENRTEADRLAGLGAEITGQAEGWCPMRSPGGFPFCLVDARPRTRPFPIGWDSIRSRLAQVCLDMPGDQADTEVAFWRLALEPLGWRWEPGGSPEFAGKLFPPAGSPIQLLFQRLDPDDPGDHARAHLDLGTDDVEADATRIESLGADRLGLGRGWIVLRDPTGMIFCTTANPPD